MKTSYLWVFLVCVAMVVLGLPSDNDLGWHLALGREIADTGQVPLVDSFSFTAIQTPWPAHSWLLDLVLYMGFAGLGYFGVALLLAMIAASAALFSVKQSTVATDHSLLLASTLVLLLGLSVFGPRSQLIAWLGITGLLWYYRHSQLLASHQTPWHWFRSSGTLYLLVMYWLWANLHASVVLGIALLSGLLTLRWIKKPTLSGLVTSALVLSMAGLVTLINPAGIDLWRFGLGIGTSQVVRDFNQEWQSLLSASFGNETFWFRAGIIGLSLALLSMTPRSLDWGLLVLGLGLSLYSARFLLLVVPAMAIPIATTTERIHRHALSVTLLICLGVLFLKGQDWCGYSKGCWLEERGYQPELVAKLEALPAGTALFNYYDWGGDLVWLFPQLRVFIDGRMDTFVLEDKPLTESYQSILLATDTWQDEWQRFSPHTALVPAHAPIVSALTELGFESTAFGDRVLITPPTSPATETRDPSQPQPYAPLVRD